MQLRQSLEASKDVDAQFLVVDPHESWSAKFLLKDAGVSTDEVNFPVLMDPSLTVSATYGLAFQMRIHTELSNRPATFVIDKQGVVQFVKRAEKFNDRPLPREIEEVLKGLNESGGKAEADQTPQDNEEHQQDTSVPGSDNIEELIRSSTSQLIKLQEDDGAWPYEGVYRVRRKIPVGYRIGGTSIVCTSLLYADQSPEATAAIERGVKAILKDLENPLMQANVRDAYDVRVWGHIYALELFCRIKASTRLESIRSETDKWIPILAETLIAEQISDGGWNYAGQRRHASFVTAPAVQALLLAKQNGADVPDSVFEKAKKVLIASRTEEGAFQYSGTVGRRAASLPGSIARSAVCELTLILLGDGNLDHLRASITAFYEHWDELEKRRKKTGTHKPPYNIAPYYFYYGHRYLAQAIQVLPEKERTEATRKFARVLLSTKDPDDTWNDRVFDRSKAYGTAMSVEHLIGNVPLPQERSADR